MTKINCPLIKPSPFLHHISRQLKEELLECCIEILSLLEANLFLGARRQALYQYYYT